MQSDSHFMGATLLLDLRNWHSSTRIHGPTDDHIRSMERKVTNHIILLFKRYIYLKRLDSHCINISGIKNFIKPIERIEHKVAFKRDKLDTHYKKWDELHYLCFKVGIVRLFRRLPQPKIDHIGGVGVRIKGWGTGCLFLLLLSSLLLLLLLSCKSLQSFDVLLGLLCHVSATSCSSKTQYFPQYVSCSKDGRQLCTSNDIRYF